MKTIDRNTTPGYKYLFRVVESTFSDEREPEYYPQVKTKEMAVEDWLYVNSNKTYLTYQDAYEENKERIKENAKKRLEKNPDYYKLYKRNRRKTDHLYRLKQTISNMVRRVLKLIGTEKEKDSVDYVTYTPEQLKLRMDVNFTDGMSHDNYPEWEIDHTIPIDHFIKKGVTDPKIINALCNLRPRWKTTRVINGVTYIGNSNKSNKLDYGKK
ncbi:hypothetical protein COB55_03580 [Candidatus Wolfebacteria bacterium]|nr:MAG: hypothetical protein COB55_03580 [Candidatus Wolfebacteria bacterium]